MTEISKKVTIFKNISWQVVAETVFKLLGFIFFLVFTRRLGQAVLGFYTYIFSILTLVNLFWDLGINSFYSRKWVTDDSEYRHDMEVIGTGRLVIIAITLIFFIPYVFHFERTIWIEFFLGTLIYIIDLFKALPPLYFISKNRFDQVFFINLIDRGGSYILAIIAVFAGYNLKAVLASMVLAKLAALFYGNSLRPSLIFGKFKWKEFKLLLKGSFPLFLVGLFGSLYFRIDSIMIKHYLDFSELGAYSAAYRLIDTGTIISSILSSSVFPILVSIQKNVSGTLSNLLTKNLKYLMVISGFMVICGMLKAHEVSQFLFGESFASSGDVLVYLAPSLFFLFLNGLLVIQMLASHMEDYLLKSLVILAAVNIVLNVYFIPHFGIKGAAMTTFISEVLSVIILYPKLPVKIYYHWLPGTIISLVAAAWVLQAAPFQWMLAVLASGSVYMIMIIICKVLDLNDLPLKLTFLKN